MSKHENPFFLIDEKIKKIIANSLILTGFLTITFLCGYFVIMWLFGLVAAVLSTNMLSVDVFYVISYTLRGFYGQKNRRRDRETLTLKKHNKEVI